MLVNESGVETEGGYNVGNLENMSWEQVIAVSRRGGAESYWHA